MAVAEIALFLQTRNNDYQQLLSEDCLIAARKHGMHVRLFSADNCPAKQVEQIHHVINSSERPQAVVVSPVQETSLRSLSRDAGKLGVGWVVLNRWSEELPALRGEFPSLPIFSVTPDQYEIGHVQGRQFKNLLPNGGVGLYVPAPSGTSSAQRRLEGLQRELDGTSIKLRTFDGDWSSEGGQRAIRQWVEVSPQGEMHTLVVGAQNDSMAAGARKALSDEVRRHKQLKVGRLHVTGCDGASSFGQRLVAEGMITATVLVPSVSGRAVDEIASVLRGGPLPPEEIVLGVSSFPDLRDSLSDLLGLGPLFGRQQMGRGQGQNLTDVALLEGLQNGERAAQAAFFDNYESLVRRVLVRILRNSPDVADALQDTFVRTFRSAPQVKDPLALRGWVLRVAESVALDQLRRRQRSNSRGATSTETVEVPVDDASVELRVAVRDAYRVLDRLPQEERVVFVMRYIDGIELAKLADVTGVSLATIKRRLSRAETRFRTLARRQPGLAEWVDGGDA
jgi:RNA polymerase sigma-70 factor, ECF subfamily